MSAHSGTMQPFEQSGTVPVSPIRPWCWSVRRELWEFRSIYFAPLLVAALIVLAFMLSATLGIWESALRIDPTRPAARLAEPYSFASLLIMLSTFLVSVFYCLEALHGERRDRSILFWKSLPVSDTTAVLSKAAIPVVVLPLLTFAITVATQWAMLLISTLVVAAGGGSVATLWSHIPLFPMWAMVFYHLITVHSLWYAPMYAWMLMVSAWARRAPLLWAGLPLLAIGLGERIAFRTSHFGHWLGYRFGGGAEGMSFTSASMSMEGMMHLTPVRFLLSPGLWGGLAMAAVFLAIAVRVRRNRGPM